MLHVLSLIVIIIRYSFVVTLFEIYGYSAEVYIQAYYYILNTITTCGYGDLVPDTTSTNATTMAIELIGIIFYGYSIQKIK